MTCILSRNTICFCFLPRTYYSGSNIEKGQFCVNSEIATVYTLHDLWDQMCTYYAWPTPSIDTANTRTNMQLAHCFINCRTNLLWKPGDQDGIYHYNKYLTLIIHSFPTIYQIGEMQYLCYRDDCWYFWRPMAATFVVTWPNLHTFAFH